MVFSGCVLFNSTAVVLLLQLISHLRGWVLAAPATRTCRSKCQLSLVLMWTSILQLVPLIPTAAMRLHTITKLHCRYSQLCYTF